MAQGLNRATLLGNLGGDPELRFTAGGQAVLDLRIATTDTFLDKDQVRRERTDWHSVVVWGKRGEALSKIVGKGTRLYIEGSIRTSSYDNLEGVKVYKTEIHATEVLFADSRGGGGQEEQAAAPATTGQKARTGKAPPARGKSLDDEPGGPGDEIPY